MQQFRIGEGVRGEGFRGVRLDQSTVGLEDLIFNINSVGSCPN